MELWVNATQRERVQGYMAHANEEGLSSKTPAIA